MESQPVQPFRFLDLPGEIRNVIYEFSVATPYRIRPSHTTQTNDRCPDGINTALLLVNKRIYHEVSGVLNSKNTDVVCDELHSDFYLINSHRSIRRDFSRTQRFKVSRWLLRSPKHLEFYINYRRHIPSTKRLEGREHLYSSMIRRLDRIHIWVDWLDTEVKRANITYYFNLLARLLGSIHKLILREQPDVRRVVQISRSGQTSSTTIVKARSL
jgi:hypothetical protein